MVSVPAGFSGTASVAVTCAWGTVKRNATLKIEKQVGGSVTVTFAAATGGNISGTDIQTGELGFTTTPVTAVPTLGFHFVCWTKDDVAYSTDNPLTILKIG